MAKPKPFGVDIFPRDKSREIDLKKLGITLEISEECRRDLDRMESERVNRLLNMPLFYFR